MYSNVEFITELYGGFDLVQKSNGVHEVVPKEDGWNCLMIGTLGGNVDRAWVYRWGEDTFLFTLNDGEVKTYHFDFWAVMLEQVENRESFETHSLE